VNFPFTRYALAAPRFSPAPDVRPRPCASISITLKNNS
jgi:hypothetical protein